MIWGVIIFLSLIGIIVVVTTIEPKRNIDDEYIEKEEKDINEVETKIDKKTLPDGSIDFRTSTDIKGDIKKLKEKINNERIDYVSIKRVKVTLLTLVLLIIVGLIFTTVNFLDKATNSLGNKLVIYHEDNNDNVEAKKEEKKKEKKTKNKKDNKDVNANINYDEGLYKDSTLGEVTVTIEGILKDFRIHREKIEAKEIEVYVVDEKGKENKIETYNDALSYLMVDKFIDIDFEKRFLLTPEGILARYIYIYHPKEIEKEND